MMMMVMKTSILGKPSSAPRVQLEVLDNSAVEEVPALQVGFWRCWQFWGSLKHNCIIEYYKVSQSVTAWWVLQCVTECNRVLQSDTVCYSMLQSVTEHYRVLQGVTECHRVIQSVTECYRVKPSVTEYNRVLQTVKKTNLAYLHLATNF